MRRFCSAAVLLALVVVSGCARQPVQLPPQAVIHHVVLVWLDDSGDEDKRRRVIEASRGLAGIPGVLEVEVGTVVPSGREIVDDSFDVGIHMTFLSEPEMEGYIRHPDHVATVRNVIAPLAERITVYDFRE